MRSVLLLVLSVTAVAVVAAQRPLAQPAPQTESDAYTRYELLAPGSTKFRILYEVTATTTGATHYFNPIRKGSIASDEHVTDRATGKPLAFDVVGHEVARAGGVRNNDTTQTYIRVTLARPVPAGGGEARILIDKTYEDAKSYFIDGPAIVFNRSLGIKRNMVVLPPGYELASCNYPSQVLHEGDGRIAISFWNNTPAEAPLVLRARPARAVSRAPAVLSAPLAPRLDERAHQNREIVYLLQQPETHAFDLYHDYTESRAGTSTYINIVRPGSTVAKPSARNLDTGEELAWEVLKGDAITKAGLSVPDVTPTTEIVVFRFPAVQAGASLRLRMFETYTDTARYTLVNGELLWDRSFGRPANAVVLPAGWMLTNSSVPATVSEQPDGRTRLDFINARTDEIAVLITAQRRRGTATSLTAADSQLVGRILFAEDSRDSASAALTAGVAHTDERVQLLARRAMARIRDPRFVARDSWPALPAPPAYADPAWRLRFRALRGKENDCTLMRTALADSAWHVRLRAMDIVGASCGADSEIVRELASRARQATVSAMHARRGVSWHAASHALVALARLARDSAHMLLPAHRASRLAPVRTYAARAAQILSDTASLRTLAVDADNNVREAAIEGLSAVAGHSADDLYLAALRRTGYQAVRAAARALAGSPRGADVARASIDAARRLRRDSSETSRDARTALMERIAEFAGASDAAVVTELATDFDCTIAAAATKTARKLGADLPSGNAPRCAPIRAALPGDAVSLALGAHVDLVVTMSPASGGGTFTVRLRGDLAPIMAARVLDLVRRGYYNGLNWHRVEPDFVIQGGSPDANEYVGLSRFLRDELGTIEHPRGTVGMSTRGHDTGDAQWFVNLRDNSRLTRDYTVFGEITSGIEVVDDVLEGDVIARIEARPAAANDP